MGIPPSYDPSDLDVLATEASGIGVKYLEQDFRERQPIQASHRHNFYMIAWITQGCGTHFIDFSPYPVKPRSLYWLAPGQVHAWDLTAPTTGYIVAFTSEFFSRSWHDQNILSDFPYFYAFQSAIELNEQQSLIIHHLIERIELEYQSCLLDRNEMLYAYLRILLIEAKRLYAPAVNASPATATVLLTQKFRVQIEANFLKQLSVSDYAKRLGITANYLNEAVKDATGQTAGTLIRDRLLLEAKRLLIHSDLTASEVANQLNFDDPSYFSRFFKKYANCSPGDFRKQTLKSPNTP